MFRFIRARFAAVAAYHVSTTLAHAAGEFPVRCRNIDVQQSLNEEGDTRKGRSLKVRRVLDRTLAAVCPPGLLDERGPFAE